MLPLLAPSPTLLPWIEFSVFGHCWQLTSVAGKSRFWSNADMLLPAARGGYLACEKPHGLDLAQRAK